MRGKNGRGVRTPVGSTGIRVEHLGELELDGGG